MSEFTVKTIEELAPNMPNVGATQIRLAFVQGTSAVNSDTLTVTPFTTVKGAFLISTTGTVGTMTFATNVITVTNGSTLTWTGLAWGT